MALQYGHVIASFSSKERIQMGKTAIGILGTGSAVPERVLTNEELATLVDTDSEWIRTRTGIRERRIADAQTASSDLAVAAARNAIAAAGISAKEIGIVICATVTPDMMFPATACLVQDRIGADHAAAFDLSAGCSGFLYGLACAVPMLQTGLHEYALVIGVDTLSRITDFTDRTTCVLFGDGAGAVVLGPTASGRGFLSFDLGADGSGGHLLQQAAGGSRMPASAVTVAARKHCIAMAGHEVFKFAVRILSSSAEAALRKAGLPTAAIDLLIPHQANIRIIETAISRLGLMPEKVYVNLERYGNMSSASIPVALDEAVRLGKVHANDLLVLVGFGAGLTWGATVVRW
jgi:3-oxoacyl-[acyl-carrier-protein] synthase-3